MRTLQVLVFLLMILFCTAHHHAYDAAEHTIISNADQSHMNGKARHADWEAVEGGGRKKLLQVATWNWKDAMIRALGDNNALGNVMINRVGQLWWDRKVPDDAKEYDIQINGDLFHVCTFNGSAQFQTMGWYGWENWGFQGNFKRVDKFTVTFQ